MAAAVPSDRSARRRWYVWSVVSVVAVAIASACDTSTADDGTGEQPITVVVAPQPDDEFQAWGSLPGGRQAGDVVHVFLTQGEQTAFCEAGLPGFDGNTGERRPDPGPEGRFTATCREARINSTLRFLERMADVDPSSPIIEADPVVVGPFPVEDVTLCRFDGDDECVPASPTVDVYTAGGAPAVLFFDLGDGDVTVDEVEWALRTVVTQRDTLGLDPSRPFGELIAASYFADSDETDCFVYDHPDHQAVSEVVRGTDLAAFGSQVVPVCAGEPGAVSAHVERDLFDAAFEVDGGDRVGHHVAEYGWLLDPFWPGDPGPGQSELFHADQWFVRVFEQPPGARPDA